MRQGPILASPLPALLLLIFALAVLAALPSCTRGGPSGARTGKVGPAPVADKKAGGAPQVGSQAATPAEMVPSAPGTQQRTQPRPAAQPAPVLAPGPTAPQNPRYYNLYALPMTHLPVDYAIGPLEDFRAPKPAHEALDAVLASFLDGLVAGSLAESTILKGRRDLIDTMLGLSEEGGSADKAPKPRSWRLGAVTTAADSAVAPLVLYAEVQDPSGNLKLPPRAVGEIRARFVDGSWYVEDVSFPLSDLGRDRGQPKELFEPPLGSEVSARGN